MLKEKMQMTNKYEITWNEMKLKEIGLKENYQ